MRLAFWGAEELGLLGSRAYVTSLDRSEIRRIRAYVNLDMIGSPNGVPDVYADGSPALARVLRRAARGKVGRIDVGGGSDHTLFREAGIPVNGYYTGASEAGRGGRPRDPCFHLACDTVRNVNQRILLGLARASARALRALSRQAK